MTILNEIYVKWNDTRIVGSMLEKNSISAFVSICFHRNLTCFFFGNYYRCYVPSAFNVHQFPNIYLFSFKQIVESRLIHVHTFAIQIFDGTIHPSE